MRGAASTGAIVSASQVYFGECLTAFSAQRLTAGTGGSTMMNRVHKAAVCSVTIIFALLLLMTPVPYLAQVDSTPTEVETTSPVVGESLVPIQIVFDHTDTVVSVDF
jgi:hypothetical protein